MDPRIPAWNRILQKQLYAGRRPAAATLDELPAPELPPVALPALPQVPRTQWTTDQSGTEASAEATNSKKREAIELTGAVLADRDYAVSHQRAKEALEDRKRELQASAANMRSIEPPQQEIDFKPLLGGIDYLFRGGPASAILPQNLPDKRAEFKLSVEKAIAGEEAKYADEIRQYMQTSIRPQLVSGRVVEGGTEKINGGNYIKVESPQSNPHPLRPTGPGKPTDTERLSKRIGPLNDARNAGKELQSLIQSYQGKDIPGVGFFDSKSAPLLAAVGFDDKGQQVKDKIKKFGILVAAATQGKRSTDKDFQRALSAFSAGTITSEDNLKSGLAALLSGLDYSESDIRAGYSDEQNNEFDRRKDRAMGQVGVGGGGLAPEMQKRLEELRAKKAAGKLK